MTRAATTINERIVINRRYPRMSAAARALIIWEKFAPTSAVDLLRETTLHYNGGANDHERYINRLIRSYHRINRARTFRMIAAEMRKYIHKDVRRAYIKWHPKNVKSDI